MTQEEWKELIVKHLEGKKSVPLKDILSVSAKRDLSNNEHPDETVRATIYSNRDIFKRIRRGVYEFKGNTLSPEEIAHLEERYALLKSLVEAMDNLKTAMDNLETFYKEYETNIRPASVVEWWIKEMDAEIKKHKAEIKKHNIDRLNLNATIKQLNKIAKKYRLKTFEEYKQSPDSIFKND